MWTLCFRAFTAAQCVWPTLATFCPWGPKRRWRTYFGNCSLLDTNARATWLDLTEVKLVKFKFLERTVKWGQDGIRIRWLGDSQHVVAFLKGCGVLAGRQVSTPGLLKVDGSEDATMLTGEEAQRFRRASALLNSVAQDRPDLNFVSRESSNVMSDPTAGSWVGLKRGGRYLRSFPWWEYLYSWQAPTNAFAILDRFFFFCRVSFFFNQFFFWPVGYLPRDQFFFERGQQGS